MKKRAGNNIKLGVLVTVCFILLVSGLYLIGARQHLFSSTFRISCIFADINGLQVGGNVRFSGINVGIVEEISQTTDSTVKVDLKIEEETRKFIKKDAMAAIGSDGLMGDKLVTITHGSPNMLPVENNDVIPTLPQVSIDDILLNIQITSENAAVITNELAYIMESVGNGNGIVGKLFFDSAFAQTLDDAMVNVKDASGGLKQNMDAVSHSFLLKGFLKKRQREKEKAKRK